MGRWRFSASCSSRPWEYFITMPGESSATINQMCWPVIIASALFQGSRDFTCELPLIGLWSTSPSVFWKTCEQKAECQFNWCVSGSRCTFHTSCKLVPGCNSRTKGLTHWYVHTTIISYSARNVWRTLSAAVERERLSSDTLLGHLWWYFCLLLWAPLHMHTHEHCRAWPVI